MPDAPTDLDLDAARVADLEARKQHLALAVLDARRTGDAEMIAGVEVEIGCVDAELATIRRDAELEQLAGIERRRLEDEAARRAAEEHRARLLEQLADVARRRHALVPVLDDALAQLVNALREWHALGVDHETLANECGRDGMRLAAGEARCAVDWLHYRLGAVLPRGAFEHPGPGEHHEHFSDYAPDAQLADLRTTKEPAR